MIALYNRQVSKLAALGGISVEDVHQGIRAVCVGVRTLLAPDPAPGLNFVGGATAAWYRGAVATESLLAGDMTFEDWCDAFAELPPMDQLPA